MKIKNARMVCKSLTTSKGNAQFDANGVADVNDEMGEMLLTLDGYTAVDGETNAETPKNTKEDDTITKADEEPVEESTEEEIEESVEDIISAMNVPQLRKFAKDNGIDLGSAAKKDEIIEIILANK